MIKLIKEKRKKIKHFFFHSISLFSISFLSVLFLILTKHPFLIGWIIGFGCGASAEYNPEGYWIESYKVDFYFVCKFFFFII